MIKRVVEVAGKARRRLHRDGAVATVKHALKPSTLKGLLAKKPGVSQTDVLGFYDFVLARPFGDAAEGRAAAPNTLTWVIPDVGIGSGGHLNIFRFIQHLENEGFDCHISVVGPSRHSDAAALRKIIRKHFVLLHASVSIGTLRPSHTTVATSWQTAYPVRDFRGTVNKCYFVQDFEPSFYATGSEAVFAEQTYRFGFRGITAGDWLAEKLSRDYGMKTSAVGFSYERELYQTHPRKAGAPGQVFFYARPPTTRRAFELGLLTLDALRQRRPGVTFALAGWDTSGYRIPFPHRNLGVVALNKLGELYSQCDAALVISLTNLSLLPLELMASGCPVVSNRGPNVEWLLNDDNAKLAEPTVEDLADALFQVLDDQKLKARLQRNGLRIANATTWQAEAAKMARVFRSLQKRSKAS